MGQICQGIEGDEGTKGDENLEGGEGDGRNEDPNATRA